MNSNLIRKTILYILQFVLTIAVFTGLLCLSSLVPRDTISRNMESSAQLLCERKVFYDKLENVAASRIDRYADSILLNIAWCFDNKTPLTSVIRSAYYSVPIRDENENFLEAVTENKEGNLQYMRYWHGSAGLVRIFSVLGNVRALYILNGIVIFLLIAVLLFLMVRHRMNALAVAICIGTVMVSIWFVPFSLEYTWTVMLAYLFSIAIFITIIRKPERPLYGLFLFSGMLTCYMDFLTTETLTLTLPLLIVLYTEHREKRDNYKRAAGYAAVWAIGFVMTWITKWVLASLILKENVMPYITEHVSERLGGNIGLSLPGYLIGALWRNLSCLFPFGYGPAGIVAGFGLLIFAIYRLYVYKVSGWDRNYIIALAVVAVIPFIRFLVLHNHSYLHYFFTHRALMGTVAAIVLIIAEITSAPASKRSTNGFR